MSEQDFNTIFSKRLKYYLNKYNMTQLELSKRLGVGTTSVYNWCNGIKAPRMDKVDKMCEIFHCKRSDFMEDKLERNGLLVMSDQDFNTTFAKNLIFFLHVNGMSQAELAKKLGVTTAATSHWCNGKKTPRMDKVDKMCEIFHCKRSDLMEDKSERDNDESSYYLDPDVKETADFLHENPEYKVLFDAAKKISKEDIDFVAKMLNKFRK